ncbi:hypothetical protein A6A25_09985 [Saccharothrix sp. CB00851]|nr:hypothetical protein A6A25_09985 [Saccharothrix sp. CB00851]
MRPTAIAATWPGRLITAPAAARARPARAMRARPWRSARAAMGMIARASAPVAALMARDASAGVRPNSAAMSGRTDCGA